MKIIGLAALSHSPSWNLSVDLEGPGGAYAHAVGEARALVRKHAPDIFVIFGPDHIRNFFFDAMPAFCIATETVRGFGDYGAPAGDLPCARALGRAVVQYVMDAGFDPAMSLNMGVDHGISQPYAALDPELKTPIVPIMINCAGGAMPSMRRCFEFGRAVGAAIRAFDKDKRVLIVGSGGLSHSPASVSPDDPAVSPEIRDYVINGRGRAREFNAAREAQSVERRRVGGTGPINIDWDNWFLSCVKSGDVDPLLDISGEALLEKAGTGGQEVRAWMAALGAWNGPITSVKYEPVSVWITGMGCITGFEAQI